MQRGISLLTALIIACLVVPAAATPGDTLTVLPAPQANAIGLAFDGEFLWTADRRTDMLYKISPSDGAVKDSLPAPAYTPCGLTWDGSRLWCVDAATELIYGINPGTGIIEKTIYCPVSQPGDLAWDGRHLWVCDDGDNKLHSISADDGTTIKTIPAPGSTPGGLTFDGTYLWVSDRSSNRIYMVTPDRGDVIIVLEAPGPYPYGLAWDGDYLWDVDYQNDKIYQLVTADDVKFNRTEEKSEEIEVIHQVRNFGPDSVKTLDVYLAIPVDRDNQVLLTEPVFSPEPTDMLTDKWGQQVAHFRFADLPAGVSTEVTMLARVTVYQNRYFARPETIGSLEDIPEEIRQKYLVDDAKFALTDPIIQNGVKSAVGDETNPYWIARKIYDYIIDHIEYERVGGWNIAPTVLDRGTGSCSEYSFVYIAMCRAAGVPARYVGSVVIRGDDASWDNVFHRWVEVYLPGFGWLPVDPSGGDSPSPAHRADYFGFLRNRFLITTVGGGGSEYLDWSYNANEAWTSKGRARVEAENFGEWTPLETAIE